MHLYELFKDFCHSGPKIITRAPDKRTGKVYSTIYFLTRSLPCFNELYNLFYVNGVKVVPQNIAELITPLGLAFWICDDGCFQKSHNIVILCTDSFPLEQVTLLIDVLNPRR